MSGRMRTADGLRAQDQLVPRGALLVSVSIWRLMRTVASSPTSPSNLPPTSPTRLWPAVPLLTSPSRVYNTMPKPTTGPARAHRPSIRPPRQSAVTLALLHAPKPPTKQPLEKTAPLQQLKTPLLQPEKAGLLSLEETPPLHPSNSAKSQDEEQARPPPPSPRPPTPQPHPGRPHSHS